MKFLGHVKHSVLPTSENAHHPHLLRSGVLAAALLAAVAVEFAALAVIFLPFAGGSYLASVLPGVVSSLTNEARSGEKLALLTENELLATAAQAKAEDMAAKGYFAHVSPDGTTPWTWLAQSGYRYDYAGENLAVNFSDSSDVVDAWLASPTHRANIFKDEYTEIGIGTAVGTYKGREAVFVVQFFGRPATGAPLASGAGTIPAPLPGAEVLGAETEPASPFAALLSSPHLVSSRVLIALASFFTLVLVFGFIFTLRLPRMLPTLGALVVIGALLGLVAMNDLLFLADAAVPADGQYASVIRAF